MRQGKQERIRKIAAEENRLDINDPAGFLPAGADLS